MCPAGLGDCLAPSQTVCESPAGVKAVLAPSQTVWDSPPHTRLWLHLSPANFSACLPRPPMVFPCSRFLFSITSSKRYPSLFWTTYGTRIVAVYFFHFSRVFSPSDVDGGSGNFPKNSDYHDRSRLTTPSCDHRRGNLLIERDNRSVCSRRASVDHTQPTTVGFCSFSLNRTQASPSCRLRFMYFKD
ncbi:hypothetical protein DPMN_079776 [Dreissena polymorpha]|uniref:Uncharacterized protein n=1 Tax=Dreissena polymorpha TaxID=45954 RepID=A0A9D3YPM3_DREPO|nr:hypothetical protein DPMN_079776 [Dreissena polymorpha]